MRKLLAAIPAFMTFSAFAEQVAPVVPALPAAAPVLPVVVATAAPVAVALATDPSIPELIQQLLAIFTNWHSVGTMASIAAIAFFLIATMKNSFIRAYVWDKLPTWSKFLVAPLLSLLATLVMVHPFSLANVWIALTSGIGAIALNSLLNFVKDLPGIKPVWVILIDVLQKLLGGKAQPPTAPAEAPKAPEQPKA